MNVCFTGYFLLMATHVYILSRHRVTKNPLGTNAEDTNVFKMVTKCIRRLAFGGV